MKMKWVLIVENSQSELNPVVDKEELLSNDSSIGSSSNEIEEGENESEFNSMSLEWFKSSN